MILWLVVLIVLKLLTNASASINSILQKQMKSANIGKELGLNFESEVRNILLSAGYRNVFNNNNNVNGVFVHMGTKSSEFDAVVFGNKNSFGNLCDKFENKYVCSPPLGDNHLAIVEAKLNARLLIDWTKSKEGSKYLFLNENSTQQFTKILVLNGGSDSEAFVNNLSSDVDIKEYTDVKKAIRRAKINVLHKLWASGETFADIVSKLNNLQNENEEIKNQNEEINNKYEEINSKYEEIKNENEEIKNQLASILTKLKL